MTGWTSLIVDGPDSTPSEGDKGRNVNAALASWVWGKVERWTEHRNNRFERRWKEYWRLWRGYWHSEDRTRDSERSKLIAPALAAAIDSQVSEVVSMFDRVGWLDLPDNVGDEDKLDMMLTRDLLLEDLELTGSVDVFKEAILNSAIFGTGILKVNTDVVGFGELKRDPETFKLERVETERALVTHEAIRPDQFFIEIGATSINEALGVGVSHLKPWHWVAEKAQLGSFNQDAVNQLSSMFNSHPDYEVDAREKNLMVSTDPGSVEIIEYHGKVPAQLLETAENKVDDEDPVLAALLKDDAENASKPIDEDVMVEAIVVVANKGYVLSAKANPFVDRSRSFVAFPWEQVPNQFWGRGIGERGYNPQKALDAELRAHIDSLGFSTFPMIGVDSGRLGRGTKLEVKPGKVWATDGNPSEILSTFKFDSLDQANFQNAADMERLVGLGTGSLDLGGAEPSAGAGPTVLGIQHASQIKRAKRAADNISRMGIAPVIKMTVQRYMQFEPTRYPTDFKFKVAAGTGIMARELEATQLNQAMLALPDELAPVKLTMVQALLNNLSLDNKAQIEKAIEQALTPDPKQQERASMMEELEVQVLAEKVREATLKNDKTAAEIRKLDAQVRDILVGTENESDRVDNETRRVVLDAQNNDLTADSNDIRRQSLALQERKVQQQATATA